MGWRFRKSFKVFPGVRLNLSGRGLSTTIGSGPASVNIGTRGAHVNFNIPGTGLSYRHKISGGQPRSRQHSTPDDRWVNPRPTPSIPQPPTLSLHPIEEIKSASTHELTSAGLQELRCLLDEVSIEQQDIDTELLKVKPVWSKKHRRCERWKNGFLFKHIWPEKLISLEQEAQELRDKVDELEEQRRLTIIDTQIEISDEIRPAFGRLFDAFAALCQSNVIWDNVASQRNDRYRQRTSADSSVERKSVTFRFGHSELLSYERQTPCMGNANGGDLYLYPGFLLYKISKQAFALVDCREMEIKIAPCQFIEEDQIPSDSQIVGHTWRYANKNGSRDLRFNNNYQIPIVTYGQMTIKSPTGLNEEYLISNCRAAEEFAVAWQQFQLTLLS